MSVATSNNDRFPVGCEVDAIDETACKHYLAWLASDGRKPEGADGLAWALGHFDDGVTWSRWMPEAASWVSSHDAAPEASPAIRQETLQELRLFGEQREVLIWRTLSGLQGRVAADCPDLGHADAMAPADETRVLRGDRAARELDNEFTLVSDATGARQVLPIRVTDPQLTSRAVRLVVRHYFQRDSQTGAVRIAMTRLVAIKGGSHGA